MPIQTLSSLPPTTTLWMYLSNQPMTPAQQQILSARLEAFLNTWAAHQVPLSSAYVIDAYFLSLFVDEARTPVSGCAMDAFVRALKAWEQELELSFFDRRYVLCAHVDGERLYTLEALRLAFERGEITPQTRFYDHTLNTKADFVEKRCQPLQDMWLLRYVTRTAPS